MNVRRTLVMMAALAGLAAVAWSGHESPVYPSYYPHEIEIVTLPPQQAGALLGAGRLHAYVGRPARFAGEAPKQIETVTSLGSFVLVKLNPGSPLAADAASVCAAVRGVARELASQPGDLIVHPYPVTPWHGDYLHQADLAAAAIAQNAKAAADASFSAGRSPRVRAEGAAAGRFLRPSWRSESAEWDVTIAEVDADALVAANSATLNGWLGPRWTRSGWFHAYLLLADTIVETQLRQRVDADLARLQTGAVADAAERANLERDLVARLTAGCRAVVAGYTVKQEFFDAGYTTGIENIASDALQGFNSPMFLRTVKLKDFPWNGELHLGTEARPDAAWNPIAGFTDPFGRLMWSAIGDPAAIPSPYDHGFVLNRISDVEASPRR